MSMLNLLEHQDKMTWTAFEISMSVQGAMGALYSEIPAVRDPGLAALAALLASGFGLIIASSNDYVNKLYTEAVRVLNPEIPERPRIICWIMLLMHLIIAAGWVIIASRFVFL